jgi:hypothetical protein
MRDRDEDQSIGPQTIGPRNMQPSGDPQTDLADKTFDERQVVLALVTPIHPASVEVGPVRLAHCVVEMSQLMLDELLMAGREYANVM